MRYDHVVKYGGEYYSAGEEVPSWRQLPQNKTEDKKPELPFSDEEIELEEKPHTYTYEELEEMTAKQMRRLAEDKGFKLTKTIRDDLINEFLSKQ